MATPLSVLKVFEAYQALQSLIAADRVNQLILSSAIRIRLAGCLRKAKPCAKEYEEEFAELGKKYGKKDDKGNLTIASDSPDLALFNEEKAAMEAEPSDVESFSTFTEADLMGKPDPEGKVKQNQIDIGILSTLMDVGILVT